MANDPIRSDLFRSDPIRSVPVWPSGRPSVPLVKYPTYDPPGAPPQLRGRAGEGVAVEKEEGVAEEELTVYI